MRWRLSFALLIAVVFDMYLLDEGMPTNLDAEFNHKDGTLL